METRLPYQCNSNKHSNKNNNFNYKYSHYNNHNYHSHNKFGGYHNIEIKPLRQLSGSLSSLMLLEKGLGSSKCPWWISVEQGKQLNFTLEDFGVATRLPTPPLLPSISSSSLSLNHHDFPSGSQHATEDSNNASVGGLTNRRLLMFISQSDIVSSHAKEKMSTKYSQQQQQNLQNQQQQKYSHQQHQKHSIPRKKQFKQKYTQQQNDLKDILENSKKQNKIHKRSIWQHKQQIQLHSYKKPHLHSFQHQHIQQQNDQQNHHYIDQEYQQHQHNIDQQNQQQHQHLPQISDNCLHYATLRQFQRHNQRTTNMTKATSCSMSRRESVVLVSTSSDVEVVLLPVTYLNQPVHYIIKFESRWGGKVDG